MKKVFKVIGKIIKAYLVYDAIIWMLFGMTEGLEYYADNINDDYSPGNVWQVLLDYCDYKINHQIPRLGKKFGL